MGYSDSRKLLSQHYIRATSPFTYTGKWDGKTLTLDISCVNVMAKGYDPYELAANLPRELERATQESALLRRIGGLLPWLAPMVRGMNRTEDPIQTTATTAAGIAQVVVDWMVDKILQLAGGEKSLREAEEYLNRRDEAWTWQQIWQPIKRRPEIGEALKAWKEMEEPGRDRYEDPVGEHERWCAAQGVGQSKTNRLANEALRRGRRLDLIEAYGDAARIELAKREWAREPDELLLSVDPPMHPHGLVQGVISGLAKIIDGMNSVGLAFLAPVIPGELGDYAEEEQRRVFGGTLEILGYLIEKAPHEFIYFISHADQELSKGFKRFEETLKGKTSYEVNHAVGESLAPAIFGGAVSKVAGSVRVAGRRPGMVPPGAKVEASPSPTKKGSYATELGAKYEAYVQNRLGGLKNFKKGGREFDGAYGPDNSIWYEAKAGDYWINQTPPKSQGFAKFRSDTGKCKYIANKHGKSYEIISQNAIPEHVKMFLEKQNIPYKENFR